jgi:hypothetical protein
MNDRHAGREDTAPLDLIGNRNANAGTVDHQTGIARQLPFNEEDALSLDRIGYLQRYPLQIVDAKD